LSKYRFEFGGHEKDDEVKGQGNSLDFGARIYDSRLGRWLSTDPLQEKYIGLSPFNFCANNPILYLDEDGMKFDLSELSDKSLNEYKSVIGDLLNNSSIFRYIYNYLDKSPNTIVVNHDPNFPFGGTFAAVEGKEGGKVIYKNLDNTYVVSQELFHTYQYDNRDRLHGGTDNYKNTSNVEIEGDLSSTYMTIETGQGFPSASDWINDILLEYDYEVPTYNDVSSDKYNKLFQDAGKKRLDAYTKEFTIDNPDYVAPKSYTNPMMNIKANAVIKTKKEAEAESLPGPRLDNGDYYSE